MKIVQSFSSQEMCSMERLHGLGFKSVKCRSRCLLCSIQIRIDALGPRLRQMYMKQETIEILSFESVERTSMKVSSHVIVSDTRFPSSNVHASRMEKVPHISHPTSHHISAHCNTCVSRQDGLAGASGSRTRHAHVYLATTIQPRRVSRNYAIALTIWRDRVL